MESQNSQLVHPPENVLHVIAASDHTFYPICPSFFRHLLIRQRTCSLGKEKNYGRNKLYVLVPSKWGLWTFQVNFGFEFVELFGARLVWAPRARGAWLLDSMPREPWYDFEFGLEHGGQMKPGDMFRDLWWSNYCICCGTGCGRCDKPICGHSSFTACCKCVCELTYPLNPACHQVYQCCCLRQICSFPATDMPLCIIWGCLADLG